MQKNTSLRQRCANSHIILPYLSIKMARRTVRCLAAAARTDPAHGVFFLLIGPKNTIQDSLLLLLLVHCTVMIFSWHCPIHKFFWSVVQSIWLSYFNFLFLYNWSVHLFLHFHKTFQHLTTLWKSCHSVDGASVLFMVHIFFSPQFACSSVGSLLFLYFIFSWK